MNCFRSILLGMFQRISVSVGNTQKKKRKKKHSIIHKHENRCFDEFSWSRRIVLARRRHSRTNRIHCITQFRYISIFDSQYYLSFIIHSFIHCLFIHSFIIDSFVVGSSSSATVAILGQSARVNKNQSLNSIFKVDEIFFWQSNKHWKRNETHRNRSLAIKLLLVLVVVSGLMLYFQPWMIIIIIIINDTISLLFCFAF